MKIVRTVSVKDIVFEDFVNYKKPSMFIAFPYCSWKCEKECGERVCQNNMLANQPTHEIDIPSLVQKYLGNPITQAIVFGGLEPLDSAGEIYALIREIRNKCNDDIVIYTGYTEKESEAVVRILLQEFSNIIIKYGRYVPNQEPHYDDLLGVFLASDNQYSKKIEDIDSEKDKN